MNTRYENICNTNHRYVIYCESINRHDLADRFKCALQYYIAGEKVLYVRMFTDDSKPNLTAFD